MLSEIQLNAKNILQSLRNILHLLQQGRYFDIHRLFEILIKQQGYC